VSEHILLLWQSDCNCITRFSLSSSPTG